MINVVRLYDLKKDPLEMNDIAADPQNKSLMDNLLLQLKNLQKEVNDQLDVTLYYNNFFKTL